MRQYRSWLCKLPLFLEQCTKIEIKLSTPFKATILFGNGTIPT